MSAASAASLPSPADRLVMQPWMGPLVMAVLAVGLMLPVALQPVRLNDSHWINLVWSEQFTALVRQGQLWPRWLPQSHDGLGAPVFYFYGPAAFWLAAVFGVAGTAPWPALLLAAGTALWASGLAMARYLAGWTVRPLAGAIAYMIAPYHLLDFHRRGALAEFAAYAVLPLIALGIRRAGGGRLGLLAAAYALLIMTHLPTALLASVFLIPLLVLAEVRRARAVWWRCAAGLALGLGLAAPYLLPALLLQHAAALGTMTGAAVLQAAQWSPYNPDPQLRAGLVFIAAVAGCVAVPTILLARRERWAWFVLVVIVLGLGVVPMVWQLPLLARVQFPWRLLVLAEFGLALVVARAAVAPERLLLLCAPLIVMGFLIVATPVSNAGAPPRDLVERRHIDVIEYLPPQVGEASGAFSRRALALAARMPADAFAGGATTLRRFAFPGWQVRCGTRIVPSGPEPGTGLLRYVGRNCIVERRLTEPERLGIAMAAVAMLLLGASALRRKGAR